DRRPQVPRPLEADMGAAAFGQPVSEAQQLARGGAKGLGLRLAPAGVVARQAADHHRALLDVNPRTAVEDDLHAFLLPLTGARGNRRDTTRAAAHLRALVPGPRSRARQQLLVLAGVQVLLFNRLVAPSYAPTSARLPLRAAYPIFIPAGERSSCFLFKRNE